MRKLFVIVFMIIIANSCASAPWVMRDVSLEKRVWRFCHEHYDGPEKHEKGFCYISQECKSDKKCRPLPLFCAWVDIDCLRKYKILQKKIR